MGHRSLQENNEKEITLVAQIWCTFNTFNILVRSYIFLKNYITSERAASHIVLYYKQLSIARYQVSFYANIYFEQLPIVSSAFKQLY